jgi:hypothetical protein
MKKFYLKPDAEYLELNIDTPIMDSGFMDGSFEIGEDDEEGRE